MLRLPLTHVYALSCAVLIFGCSDDTTNTDEVGDTDTDTDSSESDTAESESAESESAESDSTDSTDATESESAESETAESDSTDTADTTDATDGTDTTDSTDTGDPVCDINDLQEIDLTLALVGSGSNGCNDFTFTGRLVQAGAGTWALDSCPCGASCLIPDPYTLTIDVPDPDLLPDIPACPKIAVHRDPDTCEIVSFVVEDLADEGVPLWIGSREQPAPDSVPELSVTAENIGVCECEGECEPPELDRLVFDWLGTSIELSEGENSVLAADDGDWDVHVFSSHVYPVSEIGWYTWLMKR